MLPAPREVDGVSILSALKPPCRGPVVTAVCVVIYAHFRFFFCKEKTKINLEKYCQETSLLKNACEVGEIDAGMVIFFL